MVSGQNSEDLKSFLDLKSQQYNSFDFIKDDPIQIPHLFDKKEDIEISAFLTSIISWGNRKSIIKSAKKMMELLDCKFHLEMVFRTIQLKLLIKMELIQEI